MESTTRSAQEPATFAAQRTADGNEILTDLTIQPVIVLSLDEQLAFWKALTTPPKLTAAQKKLGQMVRAARPNGK